MIIELDNNVYNVRQLVQYLNYVDKDFGIPLSDKVDLDIYAFKLCTNGHVIAIVDEKAEIIGITGFYSNDKVKKIAHLPILSVKKEARGKGFAKQMISSMINICRQEGMEKIQCDSVNPIAIALYKSFGFVEYRKEFRDNMEIVYLELLLN